MLDLDNYDTFGTIVWSEFVEECEEVIEEANRQWMTIKSALRKEEKIG